MMGAPETMGVCYAIICSLLILHVSSSQRFCSQSDIFFIAEPVNKIIEEGQDAIFTCSVRLSTQHDGYINWHIDPNLYRTDISEEFSVQYKNLTSLLTIYSVGQRSQLVQCLFFTRSLDTGETCFISREARTQVQYFPKDSDLTCHPQIPQRIYKGEFMSISCKVLRSNPPVDMNFILDEKTSTSPFLSIIEDEGLTREISLRLEIKQDLHMQNITCQVTSYSVFPGRKLECIVGPIYVLSLPKVHVYPHQEVFSLIQERPLILSCMATAYPDVLNYTWSCDPPDIFEGCNEHSFNLNISLTSKKQNYYTNISSVNVTCSASNTIGTSFESSTIFIVKPTQNKICCKDELNLNVTEEPPYIYFHIAKVQIKNDFQDAIAYHILNVTVVVGKYDNVDIDCVLNKEIIYIGQNIEVTSGKTFEFAMVVHLSEEDIGKELTCEVRSTETLRRAAMNLTSEMFYEEGQWVNNSTISLTSLYEPVERITVVFGKWKFITITVSTTTSIMIIFVIGCVSALACANCCGLKGCSLKQRKQSTQSISGSRDESSISDQMYEIPNMPTVMPIMDIHIKPTGHIHDIDLRDSSSTYTSESEESFRGSTSTSCDSEYYVKAPVFQNDMENDHA